MTYDQEPKQKAWYDPWFPALIAGTVVLVVAFLVVGTWSDNKYKRGPYWEGYRACEMGIPANANPYQGAFGGDGGWMKGYIDAKQKQKRD